MGTGFTIATPLNVARYGISSVVSLVDDNLDSLKAPDFSEEELGLHRAIVFRRAAQGRDSGCDLVLAHAG